MIIEGWVLGFPDLGDLAITVFGRSMRRWQVVEVGDPGLPFVLVQVVDGQTTALELLTALLLADLVLFEFAFVLM